jgi:hypothetical protein
LQKNDLDLAVLSAFQLDADCRSWGETPFPFLISFLILSSDSVSIPPKNHYRALANPIAGVTSKLDAKTKVVWVLQAKDEAQVSHKHLCSVVSLW